jgi:hypothetical protein
MTDHDVADVEPDPELDALVLRHRRIALGHAVRPRIVELRNPEHREFFLSGLRLAAGEAT